MNAIFNNILCTALNIYRKPLDFLLSLYQLMERKLDQGVIEFQGKKISIGREMIFHPYFKGFEEKDSGLIPISITDMGIIDTESIYVIRYLSISRIDGRIFLCITKEGKSESRTVICITLLEKDVKTISRKEKYLWCSFL